VSNNIHKLLNLYPEEFPKALALFWVQLFSGIGLAFLYIISGTLLLSNAGPGVLLGGFILAGLSVLPTQHFYNIAEHNNGINNTFKLILILSAITSLTIFWVGTFMDHWIVYLLMFTIYYILYYFISTGFWGVAALAFNLRESKRIFNVIGSGDIPSKLFGYGLVAIFAQYIPLQMLLIACVVAFISAWLAFKKYCIHYPIDHSFKVKEDLTLNTSAIQQLSQNKLVKSIGLLTILFSICFTVIDYTFLTKVKASYYNDAELASFLALFFAIGRVIALIIKLLLSYRLQLALGIRKTLLILPIVIVAFAVISLLTGNLMGSTAQLYAFGILMVFAEMLKSSIYEPYYFTLFQPLRKDLRLKGHNFAKGIMIPGGQILGGLILIGIILLPLENQFHSTSLGLLGFGVFWLFTVLKTEKQYFQTIQKSILKNSFFTIKDPDFLNSPEIIQILIDKIYSENENAALLSLSYLKEINSTRFNILAIELLENDARENIVVFLLKNMEDIPISALTNLEKVEKLVVNQDNRIPILIQICRFNSDKTAHFLEYADQNNDPKLLAAVIIGSMQSSDLNAIILGGQKLLNLLNSNDAVEVERAFKIISESKQIMLHKLLLPYTDSSYSHLHPALINAMKDFRHESFIPFLIDQSNAESTSSAALIALSHYDAYFRKYHTDFKQKLSLDKWLFVLNLSDAPISKDLLVELFESNRSLDSNLISALYHKKYHASNLNTVETYLKQLHRELVQIQSWKANCAENELKSALHQECMDRALQMVELLGIMNRLEGIEDIRQIISQKRHQQYPHALEMLEKTTKKLHLSFVILAVENTLFDRSMSNPVKGIETTLLNQRELRLNTWTIAIALFLSDNGINLNIASLYPEKIITELVKIKSIPHVDH
jgi:ATP:ADP antiporter, AAA family